MAEAAKTAFRTYSRRLKWADASVFVELNEASVLMETTGKTKVARQLKKKMESWRAS